MMGKQNNKVYIHHATLKITFYLLHLLPFIPFNFCLYALQGAQ